MRYSNTPAQIRAIVDEFHKRISKGEFIIISREKNKAFMRQYRLNIEKAKSILMLISCENYIGEEFDHNTDRYGLGNVIVFKVNLKLIDFHGIEKDVCIYIKFKEGESYIPVISFHIDEN